MLYHVGICPLYPEPAPCSGHATCPERFTPGDILEIAAIKGRLDGVPALLNGDRLRYLGHNDARVLTGASRGWLMRLALDAPVIHIIDA